MTDKILKQYTVDHDHRYGIDSYKFCTDNLELQLMTGHFNGHEGETLDEFFERYPELKTIVAALVINFEPDRDESLLIELDDKTAVYIA